MHGNYILPIQFSNQYSLTQNNKGDYHEKDLSPGKSPDKTDKFSNFRN